jgi:hypothetical protein
MPSNERLAERISKINFTRKPLKGFLYTNTDGICEDADLWQWLNRGLEYVMTLSLKSVVHKKQRRS